ncbi:hypothetical protein AB0H79_05835 [Micrococcus luteus]|uniref:hypothetical protein n=1 Tax=Micrococcus luteus TaxID=1270 RepID=UPI0033FF940F
MTEERWVPPSVRRGGEEAIAAYFTLHEGLTPWIEKPFWAWVDGVLLRRGLGPDEVLIARMGRALRVPIPSPLYMGFPEDLGADPWDIADYLLQHAGWSYGWELEEILSEGGSAWAVSEVGEARHALTRRVPEGVQLAAEEAFKAEKAGPTLAKAWETLYGRTPDPAAAYRLAVEAVEHVAVEVVDRHNSKASLGTVATRLYQQSGWHLPMTKEHPEVPSGRVVKDMCRVLWDGHAGRHGGDPHGPVSHEDAEVAVGLAVTLVHWFSRGLVRREESA